MRANIVNGLLPKLQLMIHVPKEPGDKALAKKLLADSEGEAQEAVNHYLAELSKFNKSFSNVVTSLGQQIAKLKKAGIDAKDEF